MPDFSNLYNPNIEEVSLPSISLPELINPFDNYQTPVFNSDYNSGGGATLEEKYNQELNKIFSSLNEVANQPTFKDRLRPEGFDPKLLNYDRYKESRYYSELGFAPDRNNEEIYGRRQTWANVIGNALAGAWGLGKQTFIEGWKGWGNVAQALADWDASKLVGSDEHLKELHEEQMAIMNKYAIFETEESRNSIFNRQFLGSMIQQSGFTLGTLAQFLTEELLTLGASSLLSGAKAASNLARMSRIVNRAERIKDLNKLGSAVWKSPNISRRLYEGAKKVVPMLNTVDDMVKYGKAGAGALEIAAIGLGGMRRTFAEANMAFTEARMEAAGTFGDLYDKLTREYADRYGIEPTGKDLEDIKNVVRKAAEDNFLVNTGVLMLANRLQFDNLFSRLRADRKILRSGGALADDIFSVEGVVNGKPFTKVYKQHMLGAVGHLSDISKTFGKRKAAWEVSKSIGKGLFKWETSEGIQELIQEASNKGLSDYYEDYYHGGKGYSKFSRIQDALVESTGTMEGLKVFLMGALTGRIISPITSIAGKTFNYILEGREGIQRQKDEVSKNINILNAFFSNPKNVLNEAIGQVKVQDAAKNVLMTAAQFDDAYVYNNIQDSSLAALVSAAKKTDMLETVLDVIEGFGQEFDAAQLKEATGLDVNENNIQDVKSYFKTIANKIKDFEQTWEELYNEYANKVIPSLYPEGTDERTIADLAHSALLDSIQILATHKYKAKRALQRAEELRKQVASIPSIGASSVEAFVNLSDPKFLQTAIRTLDEELKTLLNSPNKSEDYVQIVIDKKRKELDIIGEWSKKLDEYSKLKNEIKSAEKQLEKIENEQQSDETQQENKLIELDRQKALVDEKLKELFKKYLLLKNGERNATASVQVTDEDVDGAYKSFIDYVELHKDHADYVRAYNILSNPIMFGNFNALQREALELFINKMKALQKGLVDKNNGNVKSVVLKFKDAKDNDVNFEIKVGDVLLTSDKPKKRITKKGNETHTYNNDVIEILDIDEDNNTILVHINDEESVLVSFDEFIEAGPYIKLSNLSVLERFYYRNRDKEFRFRVSKKYGTPHRLDEKNYSDSEYSETVSGRLVLRNEAGNKKLYIKYINPVSKKPYLMPYSEGYLKKYKVGEFDLTKLPDEEEALKRALEQDYELQYEWFNQQIEETFNKLDEVQQNRTEVNNKIDELKAKIESDKQLLSEVIEELEDLGKKVSKKDKARVELNKFKKSIEGSIKESEKLLQELESQLKSLKESEAQLIDLLNFYEQTTEDLSKNRTGFDIDFINSELNTLKQDQQNVKSEVESLDSITNLKQAIEDTQFEILFIEEDIEKLKAYIEDLKNLLSGIGDLEEFLSLPDSITTPDAFRNYLRTKIGQTQDVKKRVYYQALMKNYLKASKPGQTDLVFWISNLKDSLNQLNELQIQLEKLKIEERNLQEKLEKERDFEERKLISSVKDRIDFLTRIQETLNTIFNKNKPAVNKIADKENLVLSSEKDMTSVDLVQEEPKDNFGDGKVVWEEVKFRRTVGRQFVDPNDTVLNTENGNDRFYAFTSKFDLKNKGYELLVVSSHNDEFGIVQKEYPDDVKVIVIKRDQQGNVQYIDSEGNVLENPTADNIVYSSLPNPNSWDVNRVIERYAVKQSSSKEIQQDIDEYKKYHSELIERTKSGPVFLQVVTNTPGYQYVHKTNDGQPARAEVEGRVIVDNPDWDNLRSAFDPNAEIVLRVNVGKTKDEAGVEDDTLSNVKLGRVVLQEKIPGTNRFSDRYVRLFNRELTEEEKKNIIEVLVRYSQLWNKGYWRKKDDPEYPQNDNPKVTKDEQEEFDLARNYLKNVLCWNSVDKNTGQLSKNSFNINKGLRRGENLIVPFNEEGIRKNAQTLLENIRHHVNDYTLKNQYTLKDQKSAEPIEGKYYFATVKVVNGKIVTDNKYRNYTEYLLSKRDNGELPPLYTALPRVELGIPHKKNSYIIWTDPSFEVAKQPQQKSKPQQQQSQQPQTKQSQRNNQSSINGQDDPDQWDALIDKFINYEEKVMVINGVRVEYKVHSDGKSVFVRFTRKNNKGQKQIKDLEPFSSKEEILDPENQEQLKNLIHRYTNYNPRFKGFFKAASSAKNNNNQSPSLNVASSNQVNKPGSQPDFVNTNTSNQTVSQPSNQGQNDTDSKNDVNVTVQSQTSVQQSSNTNTSQNQQPSGPIGNLLAPVTLPNGQIISFTPEDAVKHAVISGDKIRATLYQRNLDGSYRIVYDREFEYNPDKDAEIRREIKEGIDLTLESKDKGYIEIEEPVFRLALRDFEGLEDVKAFTAWMKENLPQIPVNIVTKLIHGKAWGMFYNGAITLYDKAEIGTGFHEAFHGVWDSFLTWKEKYGLLNEFKNRKGKFTNPFTGEIKKYKDATYTDATEMMAEEFRKYMLDVYQPTQPKQKSFFKKLLDFIRKLLGLNKEENNKFGEKLHELFSKIATGSYKNSVILNETEQDYPLYRIAGIPANVFYPALDGMIYNFFDRLYQRGYNINAILEALTDEENNKLLSELFDYAFDKVAQGVFEAENLDISSYKGQFYEQFKASVSKYGVDFNIIDEELQEVDVSDTLGIRDAMTINPKETTSVNVKLLLSSIPTITYSKEKGFYIFKGHSSTKNPGLESYSRIHAILLNELSNIVLTHNDQGPKSVLEAMFEKLDNKYKNEHGIYKEGFAWIRVLKVRLKFEDRTGNRVPVEALTKDDIKLQIGFVKSFTKTKVTPQKLILGENGYAYNLNPVDDHHVKSIKDRWVENLKASLVNGTNDLMKWDPTINDFVVDPDSEVFNKIAEVFDKKDIPTEEYKEILGYIGMDFKSGVIPGGGRTILDFIINGRIRTLNDLYGGQVVGGTVNSMAEYEADHTEDISNPMFINADGEKQYSITLQSLLSKTVHLINSVKTRKELIQSAPWLGYIDENGEEVVYPYLGNSILLMKGGPIFDHKGNRYDRRKPVINYNLVSGIGTSNWEGTTTAKLQFPDRIANKIHYLLNGMVFSIINSDKSSEFAFGIPEFRITSGYISKIGLIDSEIYQNVRNSSDGSFYIPALHNIYLGYLKDELKAALDEFKNPSHVQYYSKQVLELPHFRSIIGEKLYEKFKKEVLSKNPKYRGNEAHNQFVIDNEREIVTTIEKYLEDQIEKTKKFLIDNGIVYKTADGSWVSDAIDNDLIIKAIDGDPSHRTKIADLEDGGEITRYAISDLDALAGVIAFTEEILNIEQHKLIYGHPAFYKDLAKRANGPAASKEHMVQDPHVLEWMDDNMPRSDGKVRSEEEHPTMKVISFADVNVVSSFFKDIAEGLYRDLIQDLPKEEVEKTIGATFDEEGSMVDLILDKGEFTGEIASYMKLNEADAMAWIMPDMLRDMLFTTDKLTSQQEKQWEYEMAYEKLALHNKGYEKITNPDELQRVKDIVAAGNPGYESQIAFQVLKPQYFGYAKNDNNLVQPVFLKHAVQPKFYRHVEGTNFEKLYLAAKNAQVDIIGFESGEKVGNQMNDKNQFPSLYNNKGEVNVIVENGKYRLSTDIPQQELYSQFYGIQVETHFKPKMMVIRGTQSTKLIMVNFFDNGEPINEEVGKLIEEYNEVLAEMIRLGKQSLIEDIGLQKVDESTYSVKDVSKLIDILRKEAEDRDMADNVLAGLQIDPQTKKPKYPFDCLINKDKIDNILNSIVHSRVISEKVSGKMAVQVANTLYEPQNRGIWKYNDKTGKTKKEVLYSNDLTAFYRLEDGSISSMECYINWPFKEVTPEELGLKLENGIYKIDKTNKIHKNLLDVLGYRIPTQGMNSIESIVIKGFLPVTNGDMIVVPSELTGKAGSDFDIDKLNIYLRNYYYNRKEKTLEYLEWKGDIESTKQYLSELFDKGHFLNEKDLVDLERYINEEKDLLEDVGNDARGKLLKAMFSSLFSEEKITEDYVREMKSENFKEAVINELVKKALHNRFMEIMNTLAKRPENYRQLVTPNGVSHIKSIANTINGYKAKAGKVKEDENSHAFLKTFIGSCTIRERFLTAKRMVGIGALHVTFHALAQVAGVRLKGYYNSSKLSYIFGDQQLRTIDIKLTHNSANEDGTFSIGSRKDVEGRYISDRQSEKMSGFVDGAKDPFVFDLNLNMNTASTWFYLEHHGVPETEIALLLNQPIMDDYFALENLNKSSFKRVNNNNLSREAMFIKVVSEYLGPDLYQNYLRSKVNAQASKSFTNYLVNLLNKIDLKYKNFSREDLIKGIESGGKSDKEFQVAVLMAYLEYNTQASFLSDYIRAISYDTRKTRSVSQNIIQQADWDKIIEQDFIDNPSAILENTFIGELKRQKEDIPNLFKDFFVSLSPNVREVFKPLYDLFIDPNYVSTSDKKELLFLKYQSFVLSYILHTTELDGEKLSNIYERMMKGETSFPRFFEEIKKKYPEISYNKALNQFVPIKSADSDSTDALAPVRANMDTIDINTHLEHFENLKKYIDIAIGLKVTDLKDFIEGLVKFVLIQSGLRNGKLNYTKFLPASVYSEYVKKIIESFHASGRTLDVTSVWRAFHRNYWNDRSVVPMAPKWMKIKDNVVRIKRSNPYAANDYYLKTVKISGVTNEQVKQFIKKKQYNKVFRQILLEKAGYSEDGKYVVYKPVDKWGDGNKFTEIYEEDRSSILDKNNNNSTGNSVVGSSSGWMSISDLLNNITEKGTTPQPVNQQPTTPTTNTNDGWLTLSDLYGDKNTLQSISNQSVSQPTSNKPLGTTKDNPVEIYSDGSDIKGTGQLGYGAWYEWNGKEYSLSGTETSDIIEDLSIRFPGIKFSNPTMEMIALYEVVKRFGNTSENLLIRQDYKGAVNYNELWNYSEGSEQREPKPWNAKEPHIKYLVEQITEEIKKLESNGGSISIQWVKGHQTGSSKYKIGNDNADRLAKDRNNYDNFLPKTSAPVSQNVQQSPQPKRLNFKDIVNDFHTQSDRLGARDMSGFIFRKKKEELKGKPPIESDTIYIGMDTGVNKDFVAPFYHKDYYGTDPNPVQVDNVFKVAIEYIKWVITSDHPKAQWIKNQIKSGNLEGKALRGLIYNNDANYQAKALSYLIKNPHLVGGKKRVAQNSSTPEAPYKKQEFRKATPEDVDALYAALRKAAKDKDRGCKKG